MAGLRFTCPCCGQQHEGLPDLAYASPMHWDEGAAARDPQRNRLGTDTCVVNGEHFFIRCLLLVPIRDTEERLGWGVWVSQSEANFRAYEEAFDDTPERETFGYLSNRLPSYPDTSGLRALVHWRRGGVRPLVELEPIEHPLVRDWRGGVTLERAIELARPVLHSGNA